MEEHLLNSNPVSGYQIIGNFHGNVHQNISLTLRKIFLIIASLSCWYNCEGAG